MRKATQNNWIEYIDRVEFLDERFYKFLNQKTDEILYYPSVTYILKAFPMDYGLLQWFKDVGNNAEQIANKAAESGSKVHNAIEQLISGSKIDWTSGTGLTLYDETEWKGISRFKKFIEEFNPKPISNEFIVYSHKYQYAGTVDFLCEINGENWLIDFKFANSIHKSYMLQLAAYRNAIEETTDIKIDKMAILHLKSKNKKGWELKECEDDYEFLFQIYLKTLDLFKFTNPNLKPKNLVYPNSIQLDERFIIKKGETEWNKN